MILKNFFCEKHDFQLEFFGLVRFWIKIFSPCQILNQNFFDLSDFESTFLQRVRF